MISSSKKLVKYFTYPYNFVAIFIIAIFGILVRILTLNFQPFNDEGAYIFEALMPFTESVIPHTPFSHFFYKLSFLLFGNSVTSLRLVVLLFALGSIIFTFLIAKKIYNQKIGYISVAVMMLSFWHILASTQIDIDGSYLTFMYCIAIFFFLQWDEENTRLFSRTEKPAKNFLLYIGLQSLCDIRRRIDEFMQNKYSIILSICLAMTVFTKSSGIFIFALLFLFYSLKNKSVVKAAKSLFLIYLIALLFFVILMLLIYLLNPDLIRMILFWGSKNSQMHISLIPLVYLFLWATPFLICPLILKIFNRDNDDMLFLLWFLVPLTLYFFIGIPGWSPYDRYLMVVIPALSIIAGKILERVMPSAKLFLVAVLSFLAFYSLFFVLNLQVNYLPHSISSYVTYVIHLQWNFFFPITGSSGPVFGINFMIIAIAYILCFVLLFIAVLLNYLNSKKYSKHYVILVLFMFSIGFALNAFMVEEHVFSITQPNINKGMNEEKIYLENDNPLKKSDVRIYTNQLSFVNYSLSLNSTEQLHYFTYASSDEEVLNMTSYIKSNGAFIIYSDFPSISKESKLWQLISSCRIIQSFSDKNKTIIYISICDAEK